jgi:hypothetical protein
MDTEPYLVRLLLNALTKCRAVGLRYEEIRFTYFTAYRQIYVYKTAKGYHDFEMDVPPPVLKREMDQLFARIGFSCNGHERAETVCQFLLDGLSVDFQVIVEKTEFSQTVSFIRIDK